MRDVDVADFATENGVQRGIELHGNAKIACEHIHRSARQDRERRCIRRERLRYGEDGAIAARGEQTFGLFPKHLGNVGAHRVGIDGAQADLDATRVEHLAQKGLDGVTLLPHEGAGACVVEDGGSADHAFGIATAVPKRSGHLCRAIPFTTPRGPSPMGMLSVRVPLGPWLREAPRMNNCTDDAAISRGRIVSFQSP